MTCPPQLPINLAAKMNMQTVVKMLLEIAPEDQVLQVVGTATKRSFIHQLTRSVGQQSGT